MLHRTEKKARENHRDSETQWTRLKYLDPLSLRRKTEFRSPTPRNPLFFYVNLAKIEIVLGKLEKFDSLMTAAAAATAPEAAAEDKK
ncbi:hypothetical protein CJ030_MR8G002220 [Morella rubra]|uniref:Uncharacterized protein n=1 Tax=Morella rubra TaxID=262757 RepID=A0A6A1UUI5_9ROSI|nr:hypothetical protein CJ030_MR8G002220 [Morella rubra]